MSEPGNQTKRGGSGKWLGVAMAIVGFAGFVLNWQSALEDGHYRPITALLTPLVGFLGLAFLVVPDQVAEFVAKHGEGALGRRKVRLLVAKLLALLGLIVGVVNFVLMKSWQ